MPVLRLPLAFTAVCLGACAESPDAEFALRCSAAVDTPDFVFAEAGSTIAVEVDVGEAPCAGPYRLSAMLVASGESAGARLQQPRFDAPLEPERARILIPVDETMDVGIYFYSVWANPVTLDSPAPPPDSSRIGLVVFSNEAD